MQNMCSKETLLDNSCHTNSEKGAACIEVLLLLFHQLINHYEAADLKKCEDIEKLKAQNEELEASYNRQVKQAKNTQ